MLVQPIFLLQSPATLVTIIGDCSISASISSLLNEFDSSYGPAWHCIVGTSFGSYVTHSLGGFLYFSTDKACLGKEAHILQIEIGHWYQSSFLIVAYFMLTSVAAVIEILYLAYNNGGAEVSWSEACSSFGRFCSKLKLALALHV